MELTPTLILNLALLIVPPVVLVLVFRQWLARHIRWTVALTALCDVLLVFGMNCSTMRVSVCLLCCFWYSCSHRRSSVPHLLQTKKVKYSLITTLVNIPELIRRGVFCGIKLDGILADEIGTSC